MNETSQTLSQILKQASTSRESLGLLLKIGRTDGFDTFINRKLIWPLLLGLGESEASPFEWAVEVDNNGHDYEQLQKDAQRSLTSMKTFQNITKLLMRKRQEAVLSILNNFFAKNKDLKYIQGFHDIASIFLILFGNNMGYYMMERAGKLYFFDFLTYDLANNHRTISSLILEILSSRDADFQDIFACYRESKMLMFLLPWILTWFAHVFSSVKTICRIWDYILCTGPTGVIYLAAGMLISTKEELLQLEDYEESTITVFYRTKTENQTINIEESIRIAIELQKTVLISTLQAYRQFSPQSMFRLQNFEAKLPIHSALDYYESSRSYKNFIKKGVIIVTLIAFGFVILKEFSHQTPEL